MGDDLTASEPQILVADGTEEGALDTAARTATAQLAPHVQPAATNPARVYLSSLESPGSRRTLAQALNVIADLLLPGATLDTLPWAMLRYRHTAAVRAALAERYDSAPPTRCSQPCAKRCARRGSWGRWRPTPV